MKNIALKMVKVMQECAYVQKNGFNAFNKYKYASAADILEKVNDSLVKNNVASFVSPKLIDFKDVVTNTGKAEHLATVEVSILLVDADSGESITVTGLGSGQDNGDKGIMKAQTAAIKYAWMMSLNISTGDDPEADSGVDERNSQQATQTKVNAQTTTQKPATTQAAKPQAQPAKITDTQVKSLMAKCSKEGITVDDLTGLIEWKYKTKLVGELKTPDFAQLMNSLPIVWKEYVVFQSKAS
jgi:hypothetical protein